MSEHHSVRPDKDMELGEMVLFYPEHHGGHTRVPAMIIELFDPIASHVTLMVFDPAEHMPYRVTHVPYSDLRQGKPGHWTRRYPIHLSLPKTTHTHE